MTLRAVIDNEIGESGEIGGHPPTRKRVPAFPNTFASLTGKGGKCVPLPEREGAGDSLFPVSWVPLGVNESGEELMTPPSLRTQ